MEAKNSNILIEDLKWRHACKAMNGKKVSDEKLHTILDAINLTPTSLGLQAFKVLVVKSEKLKKEIFDQTCQQQPVIGCSHLLIFTSYKKITDEMLDEYFNRIKEIRKSSDEWLNKYKDKIRSFMAGSNSYTEEWLARQTYIALGLACAAAAVEKVDSVPIEGYDRNALDKLLNLDKEGLTSTLLFPIGYQDEEKDWLSHQPKVRKQLNEIIENID